MVWFQCEDCGENLKKPKLPNHFRICSAQKLSCIDCGEMFNRENVQGHTQCITEAEKYGPKSEGKSPHGVQSKPEKPKKNADVDIHVGLSSRAPWFCSLCNAQATSRQTLLAHADGKKHRAKARAYHASQKPASEVEVTPQTKNGTCEAAKEAANGNDNIKKSDVKISNKDDLTVADGEKGNVIDRKRKHDVSSDGDAEKKEDATANVVTNGIVIQKDFKVESQKSSKKQKSVDTVSHNGHPVAKVCHTEECSKKKIKLKKLAISILKSNPDSCMKLKKLQKLAIETFKKLGVSEDEVQLAEKLLEKISSSSRFVIESKHVRLAAKGASS